MKQYKLLTEYMIIYFGFYSRGLSSVGDVIIFEHGYYISAWKHIMML